MSAVNSHTNSLAQDYALVISSGNVVPNNNVNLAVAGPYFTNDFGRASARSPGRPTRPAQDC